MNIELTDEEFETLKNVFDDWGSDCPDTDVAKWRTLGEKLGFIEPIPEPTAEEIKRREEFAKSMRPILEASNHLLEGITFKPIDVLFGQTKIGSTLRIKLPNDYKVTS
jgi:hypothetical protein